MPKHSSDPLEIEELHRRKAALFYRAVNHKLRQKMLQFIYKNEPVAVTAIYTKLRLEQSVASQHLAILRRAGLVDHQKEGKHVYYSIQIDRLQQLHTIADELLKKNAKRATD